MNYGLRERGLPRFTTPMPSGVKVLGGQIDTSKPNSLWMGINSGLIVLILGIAIAALVMSAYTTHHYGDSYHKNVRRSRASVGFSMYKNGSKVIATGTPTKVDEWEGNGGGVTYDNSDLAFDKDSGEFETKTDGIYLATATLCYVGTNNGFREAALVNNATTIPKDIVFEFVAGSNETTLQCLHLHQIMQLVAPDRVWLLANHDSGIAETITDDSRFAMERLA